MNLDNEINEFLFSMRISFATAAALVQNMNYLDEVQVCRVNVQVTAVLSEVEELLQAYEYESMPVVNHACKNIRRLLNTAARLFEIFMNELTVSTRKVFSEHCDAVVALLTF